MAKKLRVVLLDSGVFFRYLRRHPDIVSELDKIGFENLGITSVSVGETYQGMFGREKARTQQALNRMTVYHIDTLASRLFVQLMAGHYEKGLQVPDAMIAAVALTNDVELFTLNRNDFSYIPGIKLYNPSLFSPEGSVMK
jgi:tRNA(fMet)-specific endonuclease VapC